MYADTSTNSRIAGRKEKYMDYEQGSQLLENALKGFHGKFKKMYGQIALRLTEDTYITTGGTKALSDITPDYFEVCDNATGELGAIFRAKKDINAIVFGCSPDAVKASEDGTDIPCSLEDIAMIAGPSLHVIADASPEGILAAFDDANVCLIKGVGIIAAGSNLKKAVAGVLIAEKECEAATHGDMIGGTIALKPEDAESYRQSFFSDYTNRNEEESVPYVGFDEEEFALRSALIDFGKDLVRHDLSYGSWGNLSVRINDDEMLITPSSIDYFEIKIEDIVKVNIHSLEYGDQRMPSSEAPMHARIYQDHPDATAVIHTHSNAVSVFAACESGFMLRDPNLKELIGDVVVSEYAPAGSEELAEAVSKALSDSHACIIPHHGAVFYGPSLDVVFAIAEAVELKARNLLDF